MFDKQENAIFIPKVYNGDYTYEKRIYLGFTPKNHEIATDQRLEAYRLVDEYEKGQLKGKLKEIAAKLDAEDNPVIMLVKHKK